MRVSRAASFASSLSSLFNADSSLDSPSSSSTEKASVGGRWAPNAGAVIFGGVGAGAAGDEQVLKSEAFDELRAARRRLLRWSSLRVSPASSKSSLASSAWLSCLLLFLLFLLLILALLPLRLLLPTGDRKLFRVCE